MRRTTPDRPIDIEAIFPELTEYRRTGTRLHPRQGSPTLHESSVGGPLLWPAREQWPVCTVRHDRNTGERLADVRSRRRILDEAWRRDPRRGPSEADREILDGLERGKNSLGIEDVDPIPLLSVAQFFTRDFPGLSSPDGCDLLQFFWCPFEAHGSRRTVDVYLKWRRAEDVADPLPDMPEPEVVGNADYVPNPCVLTPERVVEHEYVELLSEELQERIGEWEEEQYDEEEGDGDGEGLTYQHDLSIPPGWRIGGYASWPLTGPAPVRCSCGSSMRPLLTVHNREWDLGTLSWVPVEDRPEIGRMGANTPTGVSPGRGRLCVFICPVDPGHPHLLGVQ
ncbi:hypothetical protein ACIOWG_12370 [Streptomyces sp. NPDC087658]|uniref:hypothetical protein n=1 Tax=Streptomyces sp. NPDC087658 TaxID=3365800 RepID=UPI003805AB78